MVKVEKMDYLNVFYHVITTVTCRRSFVAIKVKCVVKTFSSQTEFVVYIGYD